MHVDKTVGTYIIFSLLVLSLIQQEAQKQVTKYHAEAAALVLQGRSITPATCLLELASAASKLLRGEEDGVAPVVAACAMGAPLILAPLFFSGGGAGTVACSIDLQTGALRITTAAVMALRQSVQMTAQLQSSFSTPTAVGGAASAATPQAEAASLGSLPNSMAAIIAEANGPPAAACSVYAAIDARCQLRSGYAVHPAVADAAIHCAAAARISGDTDFMISAAVGAYLAQELTLGPVSIGVTAHAGARLTTSAADGTVTSSHSLSTCGGSSAGSTISGVVTRPFVAAASTDITCETSRMMDAPRHATSLTAGQQRGVSEASATGVSSDPNNRKGGTIRAEFQFCVTLE